jgi:hypothetical protein
MKWPFHTIKFRDLWHEAMFLMLCEPESLRWVRLSAAAEVAR